jgi:hypothetical protein
VLTGDVRSEQNGNDLIIHEANRENALHLTKLLIQ